MEFFWDKLSKENRDFIIDWSKRYKKIDSLSLGCEEYERKPYFHKLSLAQARLKFRERSKTMKTCRTQFPGDTKNFKARFECFHCDNIDTLIHWRTCPSYFHLRQSKNLDDDFDLTTYYSEIIKMRANLDEQ